jgi:hypothetical protein
VVATVYRGNKACGILAESLIVKTSGSVSGEACWKAHGDLLACGEGLGISMELPDWELSPCEGFLVRGSNED